MSQKLLKVVFTVSLQIYAFNLLLRKRKEILAWNICPHSCPLILSHEVILPEGLRHSVPA
jgi:hypothetical protein